MSKTNLFHRVIYRHQSLQAFPLKEVRELHVDGLHGAGVLHDPVLVHVRSVVVTGCAVERSGIC